MAILSDMERPNSTKRARKCCGLSVTTFIIVLVILVLLIAAAILIPIFLVAVPHERGASALNLKKCSASHACQNNAISVVDNNACSCVCVDGFTGSDCSTLPGPNCATADITDGSHSYDNATLGSSIVSLLQQAQGKMNIPLNTSVLLAVFANNNLTCAGENSLVDFDLDSKRRDKRLFILPGFGLDEQFASKIAVPSRTTVLAARDAPAQTSTGSAYQQSSSQVSPSAAISIQPTATVTTTQSASSASSTSKANITSNQLEFAQLVVLYVLAGSRVPSTAVNAQQDIEQYFRAGALASGNSTVDVVRMGGTEITANFETLTIILGDGKVIGGSPTNR